MMRDDREIDRRQKLTGPLDVHIVTRPKSHVETDGSHIVHVKQFSARRNTTGNGAERQKAST